MIPTTDLSPKVTHLSRGSVPKPAAQPSPLNGNRPRTTATPPFHGHSVPRSSPFSLPGVARHASGLHLHGCPHSPSVPSSASAHQSPHSSQYCDHISPQLPTSEETTIATKINSSLLCPQRTRPSPQPHRPSFLTDGL